MAVTDSGILQLMSRKMSYLGKREAVLAQNVANANTPGYKAKETVSFETFAQALQEASGTMKVTQPGHIVPASMAGVNAATKKTRSFETVPSGNSVDLEQQMMEVSKTTMDYQASASIFQKFMAMMRLAIGR